MAGIGVLAFAIAISVTQSYTDPSDDKIRIAFFPSIVHAVPIVGMENEIFHQNLSDETKINTCVLWRLGYFSCRKIYAGDS